MEVAQYEQGEWLEIPHEANGKPDNIRLKIKWMSFREAMRFSSIDSKSEDGITEGMDRLAAQIVDWNLTLNGEAVPCTEENKDRYVEMLLNLGVKNAEGKDSTVAKEILAFAVNSNSFLKNSQPTSPGTKIGTSS